MTRDGSLAITNKYTLTNFLKNYIIFVVCSNSETMRFYAIYI